MATIVYLDVDDEITTAASRIRATDAPRVGMVIPSGSRVATSRINFRLLAREAQEAGRRLDVVAPDASARALAASAGLPVFASVGEYEAALAAGESAANEVEEAPGDATPGAGIAAGAALAGGSGRGASAGPAGTSARAGAPPRGATPPDGPPIAASSRSAGAAIEPAPRPVEAGPAARRRRPRPLLVAGILVLVLAIGVGGAAAAIVLPSAEITVTPVFEAVPPLSLTATADPKATAVDSVALVIPATVVEIPVSSSGDFPATGTSVQQSSASGQVTFDSTNTVNQMPVPRGTRVSTLDGIVFATTAAVTVPRATVSGSTITHGFKSVGVVAIAPGPKGNVPARSIDQVPSSLAALQVSVSNAAPTTGGTRTEYAKITAADVTAAQAKLGKDLAAQMAAELAKPELVPAGATLYPTTATLGAATFVPDPGTLSGKVLKPKETTFTLAASATGTVMAVDESPLQGMGETALAASVTPGYQLVDGSTSVTVGQGTVTEDGMVGYTITGTALQRRPIDPAALKALVLGRSAADAKAALETYGKVDVVLWPGWVTSVPTMDGRVTVVVAAPVRPAATPSPMPTRTPTPSRAAPSAGASEPAPSASPVPSGG